MAIQREFEGATLEEALGRAALKLGVPEPDLHYEILETGRRGVFGMGARKVRIRVDAPRQLGRSDDVEVVDRPSAVEPAGGARAEAEEPPEGETASELEGPARDVRDTVQRMVDLMGLKLRVRAQSAADGVRLEVGGADRKLLLQKDAELLSALQFLLNRMARRAWPGSGRVALSCDGYRNQRDDEVVELAREVAQQVAQTGKAKRLHPMNPYERRLVHMTVREMKGVSTRSEGDGFLKKILVFRK